MKRVIFVIALTAGSLSFMACKQTPSTDEVAEPSVENSGIPAEELALAEPEEAIPVNSEQFLYVTAPSGLSLREYNNLQSEKIAKMPYGTKVRVLRAEDKQTMTVSGIPGAMDEIEYNHKKGYAFNGYLSPYFPPEQDITAEGYAAELKAQFPEVSYTETPSGSKSLPVITQTLILPKAQWHEAFLIAQRLFDFPKEFEIPNPKGKDFQIIVDNKPKKGIWTSQLEITRKDNAFQKIEYLYTAKNFKSRVSLSKDGNHMVLTRQEEVVE